MSTGAQPASGIAKYRIVRELGARSQRSYAAIREPHELVVVHRFVGKGSPLVEGAIALSSEELGLLLRDAQCLAKNWHPNIARIKHVDLASGDLTVASELVDGSTLADLFTLATAGGGTFPLDVLVRVLLDVLAGVHGIHALRDGRSVPIGAIHGELCPANIVVGRDGIARLINVLRPRPPRITAASEAVGHAAPETLDGGAVDGRADVHAVGVILWEALSGRPLHDEKDPARVLSRQREIDIPRPTLPPGSPYAALADIAMRALAFDPALRFRTAAEMASALRKLPAARIATGSVVASKVLALDGDRIRRRRAALDPTSSGGRRRASDAPIVAAQAKLAAPKKDEPAPESEPPASMELEEIPASAPETVRHGQPSAPQPPPVPPRVAPSPPKPALPRPALPVVAAEKKPGAPIAVAQPRPASAPVIEERVTVPGSPAMLGALAAAEERVTVPGSPVLALPLAAAEPAPVLIVQPPAPEHAPAAEEPALANGPPLASLARSTSSAVADEPSASEESIGAGFTALDDVEAPQVTPRRRRRWGVAAIAAVLLLGGVFALVLVSRSGSKRTAGDDVPIPSEVATITTAPITPPTGAPAGEPPIAAAITTATSTDVSSEVEPAGTAEPAGPTAAPQSDRSVEDAPKPAPRAPTQRRYEPLGI